jgi:hypothetical protein
MVIVKPAEKSKIEVRSIAVRDASGCASLLSLQDYGSPEQYLNTLAPLLGQQAWQGESMSEGVLPHCCTAMCRALTATVRTGGFAPGKVSVANVLTVGSKSSGGKTYYQYEVLTRTADGDEGGRHHLFSATVSNGKLYILKMQAGDKRWFKGVEREAKRVQDSFSVL